MDTQPNTVTDLRKRPRFRMREEVRATFAGTPAVVLNLSAEGLAVRHASQIKVNSSASIHIESEENTAQVSFRGRVRWSHISRTKTETGALLFESGLQIEQVDDATGGLLGRLIRAYGEKDTGSLQKKQEEATRREQARTTMNTESAAPQPTRTITRDQVLLIREAKIKLEQAPDLIQDWYARAKQALEAREPGASPPPNRREVVAIWGYLGCKIDFDVIAAVLDAETA